MSPPPRPLASLAVDVTAIRQRLKPPLPLDSTAVITRLLRAGWEVLIDDEQLVVRHATEQLTPAQQRYLTQHHDALLAALDVVLAYEERAASLEYDGGLAREDAEALARPLLEIHDPERRPPC